MSVSFCAKAILKEKIAENNWTSKEVTIDSVQSILDIFEPYQKDVEQVNLSLNSKVYYSIGLMKDGVDAIVKDQDDDRQFMCSPLLLVECDSEKPIDISYKMLKSMEEAIDFF